MDTLTAYLSSSHIAKALERERVTQSREIWRESFGHPSHKAMLTVHDTRVAEFYGRGPAGSEPATPDVIAELVSAVMSYRPPKKYKPKPKPGGITADRLLQIAVQAAERKGAA